MNRTLGVPNRCVQQIFEASDEKSTLQKEKEDNDDIDCLMKTYETSYIDSFKEDSLKLRKVRMSGMQDRPPESEIHVP